MSDKDLGATATQTLVEIVADGIEEACACFQSQFSCSREESAEIGAERDARMAALTELARRVEAYREALEQIEALCSRRTAIAHRALLQDSATAEATP